MNENFKSDDIRELCKTATMKVGPVESDLANNMARNTAIGKLQDIFTPKTILSILDELESKKEPDNFCKAFETWATACTTPLEDDDEYKTKWRNEFRDHWKFIRLAIHKSCLLDRLIYGNETLRTELCPVHKGRWSGCSFEECEHGCMHGPCVTGWIRNPDDPESTSSGVALVRLQGKSIEMISPSKKEDIGV